MPWYYGVETGDRLLCVYSRHYSLTATGSESSQSDGIIAVSRKSRARCRNHSCHAYNSNRPAQNYVELSYAWRRRNPRTCRGDSSTRVTRNVFSSVITVIMRVRCDQRAHFLPLPPPPVIMVFQRRRTSRAACTIN